MKVDLSAQTALQAAEQSAVDRTKKDVLSETASPTAAATTDQSSFQPSFPAVATLVAQAKNVPAMRQEKVSALKQQVADGSYELNADTITSALIASGGR